MAQVQAHKQQLLDALQPRLEAFHAASSANNAEEIRQLFSGFAGKELSSETLMQLLAAGHELEAVARAEGDGKGVSLDQLLKLCSLGFQATDTVEALGAVLDTHIEKLSGGAAPAATAAGAAPGAEPGAQV